MLINIFHYCPILKFSPVRVVILNLGSAPKHIMVENPLVIIHKVKMCLKFADIQNAFLAMVFMLNFKSTSK